MSDPLLFFMEGYMWDCITSHRRHTATSLLIVVVFLTAASIATAGQDAAGIVGQVTDEWGRPPGRFSYGEESSLQVPAVTTVTDGHGEYRTQLSIGTFEVAYELSGFQLMRREACDDERVHREGGRHPEGRVARRVRPGVGRFPDR
jgi:hypothetical protein